MSDPNLLWYVLAGILAIPLVLGALGRIVFEFTKFAFSPMVAVLFIVLIFVILEYWVSLN